MSSCTVTACIILVLTADYAAGITGTNHLSCSPVDDNGYSTFPDYPVDRHQLSDTSVITLSQFLTIYSFTPDPYCRGNITGADFCFQYPLNENSSRVISVRIVFHILRLVRIGALLVPVNNSVFGLWGLPIDRTSCIEREPDTLQCCERMTFFGGEKIPLDGGELLLGLFATNSEDRYPLLRFTAPEYFVTAYEVDIGLLSERFITTNNYTAANTLERIDPFPVLRFVVEPDPNIQMPTTEIPTTEATTPEPTTERPTTRQLATTQDNTPMPCIVPTQQMTESPPSTAGSQGVMSVILYAVIVFLVLLSVSLFVGLVVAIVSCCRLKKKAKKNQSRESVQAHELTAHISTASMGVVNPEYETIPAAYLVPTGGHPPPYANPACSNDTGDYIKMNMAAGALGNAYSHTMH